ncbi:MAG: hypothetical protein R2825_06100 [Saprospiraceae bacterium]
MKKPLRSGIMTGRTKGAQFEYSDSCIECLLQLKAVFRLRTGNYRAFSGAITKIMGFDVVVLAVIPRYAYRAVGLDVDIEVPKSKPQCLL